MASDWNTRLSTEIAGILASSQESRQEGEKRLSQAAEEWIRAFVQRAETEEGTDPRLARVIAACRSAIPSAGKRLGEIFVAAADRRDEPDDQDLKVAGLGYAAFLVATKGDAIEPLDVATAMMIGYRAGQRRGR